MPLGISSSTLKTPAMRGAAERGRQSRAADAEQERQRLGQPHDDGLKRHHRTTLAARSIGVRDASHLDRRGWPRIEDCVLSMPASVGVARP